MHEQAGRRKNFSEKYRSTLSADSEDGIYYIDTTGYVTKFKNRVSKVNETTQSLHNRTLLISEVFPLFASR